MDKLLMRIATIFLCSSYLLCDAANSRASEPLETHGTINIVVSLGNNAVIVTDSMASDQAHDYYSPDSPKLFQLDDATMCSIAGFGTHVGPMLAAPAGDALSQGPTGSSVPTPRNTPSRYEPLYSVLPVDSAAIIASFRDSLQTAKHRLKFDAKVDALAGSLALQLKQLATELDSSSLGAPDVSELQVILVGYDTDRSLNMVRVDIRAERTADGSITAEVSKEKAKRLGEHSEYLISGYPKSRQAVEDAIGSPSFQKKLAIFSTSKPSQVERHLEWLTTQVEKFENLAVQHGDRVVGGPIQEATLLNGGVQFHSISGLRSIPSLGQTFVIDDLNMKDSLIPFFAPPPSGRMVLVDVNCDNATLILDRAIIIRGTFKNCRFITSGQQFFTDPNDVAVENGTLMIAPNVTDQAMDAIACKLPGIVNWTGFPKSWGVNGQPPSALDLRPIRDRCTTLQ